MWLAAISRDKPQTYFAMGRSGMREIVVNLLESFEVKPYRVIAPVKVQLDVNPVASDVTHSAKLYMCDRGSDNIHLHGMHAYHSPRACLEGAIHLRLTDSQIRSRGISSHATSEHAAGCFVAQVPRPFNAPLVRGTQHTAQPPPRRNQITTVESWIRADPK